MGKVKAPIIYKTNYGSENAQRLDDEIMASKVAEDQQEYLIDYPTVYVIDNPEQGRLPRYTVYVGETNDIQRRTVEHLKADPEVRDDWEALRRVKDAEMYVIGHEHFNKSLTLDIENRLMQYLSSVESVSHLNNRRENAQNRYYTSGEMVNIFDRIWAELNKHNAQLFPARKQLEKSALFKASPFNKLTTEQLTAKRQVLSAVTKALETGKKNQLVKVTGEAGAGKTVLMSNIFYELARQPKIKIAMMVNHPQQEKVYRQIVDKLDLGKSARVVKAATFVKKTSPEEPIDVAFVDEAHLLWTQHNQAYNGYGTNELIDIIKRARVTLAVYDEHQVLQTGQIVEKDDQEKLASFDQTVIHLANQMRIAASPAMVAWLRRLIDEGEITKAPADRRYDLRVFDSPAAMEEAIRERNAADKENGLSRMVATFDWKYSPTKPKDEPYWEVKEGDWHMPWNLQLKPSKEQKQNRTVKYADLAWPEQPHTIREIGSTYTVQGFDLNYVGVEIGPSVKYREGKIVFDPTESANRKAISYRTMHNGKKQKFAQQLLKNELNVLLTRGVHGLYLHAVDKQLQAALKAAVEGRK